MKITEEQLKQIQAQVKVRSQLVNDIGAVEAQKHELLHALNNVMEKTKETADKLEEEYGKININLEDGSYEAVEEKELEQLVAQQSVKAGLISDIGAVEARKHELLHAFAEVVTKSKELNETLEEKYGKITVNLEDGSYEEIVEEDGQAD